MNIFKKLVIFLLCTSLHTYANTSDEDYLTGFIDNFSSRKIESSASRYLVQTSHFIFDLKIFSPSSAAEVEAILADIRFALEKRDYARSEIVNFQTQFRGENLTITSALLKRYTSHYSLLDHICSTYTLANTEKGWKILSWLPSPLNQLLSVL
ncbi:hypothetical protein Misp06_00222 [Microbulbifer sp. NBRC 101763]